MDSPGKAWYDAVNIPDSDERAGKTTGRQPTDMIKISDRISYIAASDDPLSADIGIIRDGGTVWLYDVGNGENSIAGLTGSYHVVLSHFHADHAGNIGKIRTEALYVSRDTFRHVHNGTVILSDTYFGSLHIFPIPSSHARGCLGLEVDEMYAFVGDALYCKARDGCRIYNAQLLQNGIRVLEALKAPYLLVSHYQGLIRRKDEALEELKAIYGRREKNSPEIRIPSSGYAG